MPEFKNKEEYEQWKAQRLKDLQEKKETRDLPPGPSETTQKDEKTHEAPRKREDARQSGELSGIGDLFKKTWGIYKERIGTLIALYLLSVLFFAVAFGLFFGIGFLLSLLLHGNKAVIAAGAITGALVGMVVMTWGLGAAVFAVVDKGLGIKDALDKGWDRVGAFIWFFSLLGFIVTGGFLLLFIPGVIFLVWFSFGQFVLAAEDERGMNALIKSKEYVRGQWLDVFLRLFMVSITSAIIGMVPVIGPLLSLLFAPFMMIFTFLIYEDLRTLKGALTYRSSAGEKFKWIGAGTLGYLVLPVVLIALMGASLTIPLFYAMNMMKKGGITLSPESLGKMPKDIVLPQAPEKPEHFPKPGEKKPAAAGEAFLTRDGVQETYILKTGFFSDTRFKDPKTATVMFQIPAEEHSNARRIEITLDATRAGKHYADGKTINDSMFRGSPLNIGEATSNGITASLKYVADGGQIFPPRDSCTITITSPYSGTPDGVFAGEVSHCVVHSAGIDHTLSSVKFRMTGVPSH